MDKKHEFNLNESIINYESVKSFGNEKLELQKYSNIVDGIKK